MEKSEDKVVNSPIKSDQEQLSTDKTLEELNSNNTVQNHVDVEQSIASPNTNKARDSINTKVSEENNSTSVGDCDDSNNRNLQTVNGDSNPDDLNDNNQNDAQLCRNMIRLGIVSKDNKNTSSVSNVEHTSDNSNSTQNTSENKIKVTDALAKLFYYSGSSDSESSSSDAGSEFISDDEDTPKDIPSKSNVIDNKYREPEISSDDSDSTSSSESDSEESEAEGASGAIQKKSLDQKQPRTKGELDLEELPPVPDISHLSLDIKEEDCVHMGHIESIVDKLVMVQSLPNMPAYDLDTVLFLDNGKRPLGHVYDVLGPVTCPMYVIRFNSKEDIASNGIVKELRVYSAPKMDLTHYVFLKQLLQMKGSDASWKGDNEVPPEFVDYSDDEVEFCFSVDGNNEQDVFKNKRKRPSTGSTDKHRQFESEMNLKNKLDTARHRVMDSIEPAHKRPMHRNNYTPRHMFNSQFPPDPRFAKPRVPPCAIPHMPFNVLPPPMAPYAVIPPAFAPMPIPQVYGIPPQPFPPSFPNQFSHHFAAPPPHPFPPPNMVPTASPPKIPLPSEMQQSELLKMLKKMPPPPPPPIETPIVQSIPIHIPPNTMPSPSLAKQQHMPQNPQSNPACQRLFPPSMGLPKPNGIPSIPSGTTNGTCLPPAMSFNYYPHPWQYEMPPPNIRGRQNFQPPPHGRNSYKKQQP